MEHCLVLAEHKQFLAPNTLEGHLPESNYSANMKPCETTRTSKLLMHWCQYLMPTLDQQVPALFHWGGV